MATVGSALLLLVLALVTYATVASVLAGLRRDRRLMRSAGNAVMAAFVCTVSAVVLLEIALLRSVLAGLRRDRRLMRSAGNAVMAAFVCTVSAVVLLEIALVRHDFSIAVVLQNRHKNRELLPWVTAVLGGCMVFFASMATIISSPFERTAGVVPHDGFGLDPSLQNPYMAAHPPALYLGYVSFAVPFAFAMAALITRRTDARWLASVRRWTLFAWASLGVGMLLGAHWAYVEIGWGGYWGWDPVENAALMPWLAGTAYLHSVMVQEKRGMLKVWNVVLVTATFALSIFGTFLTRSGVVDSIHSFVQSPVGPALLVFLSIVLAFATTLLVWRLPLLRSDHKLESVVSREATFLFNNLLLLAFAFVILWGVVFPLLSEAVRGVRSTVSVPYYNFFLVAFGLPLLALTGIGPLIAWRRATPGSLWRTFRWPVISAAAGGALLALFGLGSSWPGLTAFSLCIFVTVTIGLEFARGASARRAIAGGSWPRALIDLVSRNRRRYGGYVVHLAVVLLVVGIAASGAYGSVNQAVLKPGQSMQVGGYTLTYTGMRSTTGPNYVDTAARLVVSRGGGTLGTLYPAVRDFTDHTVKTQSNEVDIRHDLRGVDVYTILQGADPSRNEVVIKALVNPMVSLIWLAGLVFVLGAAITIWPDPREARQLARRYSTALAKEA